MKPITKLMTETDVSILRKKERTYLVALVIIVTVLLFMCLVLIPANDGWEVAGYVGATMFVVVLFVGLLFRRLMLKTRKDRYDLMKVCGAFVIKKSKREDENSVTYYLHVNYNNEPYKIQVKKVEYDAVPDGGEMYIEFAPHSATLLMLNSRPV